MRVRKYDGEECHKQRALVLDRLSLTVGLERRHGVIVMDARCIQANTVLVAGSRVWSSTTLSPRIGSLVIVT